MAKIDTKIIPNDVKKIVKILEPDPSYVVGGVVRDIAGNFLLSADSFSGSGRKFKTQDWDIATRARPETVIRKAKKAGLAALPIGIEHGTVVLHFRNKKGKILSDRRYEVTTFRYDTVCYGRHAEVEFADSLEEDLFRRDFTINALALDPGSGQILDLHHGIDDLRNGIVRAVGDPFARFREDYLRILRAIRFASAIHGGIEPVTWAALCREAEGIKNISAERIREELWKILQHSYPSRAFLMMEASGLLKIILPELDRCFGMRQNRYHVDDIGVHTLLALDAASPARPLIRMAVLLHDVGKAPTRKYLEEKQDFVFYNHEAVGTRLAKKIMRRLRFSTQEVNKVEKLVQYHMYPLSEEITKKTVRRWLNRMEPENFRDFLRVRLADRHGNRRTGKGFEPGFYRTVRMLREIEKSREAFSLKDLAVNGKDLMKAGIRPGPGMGVILNDLLERVLDEPGLNQKHILMKMAREIEAAKEST